MPHHYAKFRKISPGLIKTLCLALGVASFLAATRQAQAQIPTAIGSIPTSSEGLAFKIAKIGVGMASGVGVLLVLYGAIKYNLSKGDPRGLEEAKDTITAALAGLAVVVLAVTIMGWLGADILGIPGLGGGGGFSY